MYSVCLNRVDNATFEEQSSLETEAEAWITVYRNLEPGLWLHGLRVSHSGGILAAVWKGGARGCARFILLSYSPPLHRNADTCRLRVVARSCPSPVCLVVHPPRRPPPCDCVRTCPGVLGLGLRRRHWRTQRRSGGAESSNPSRSSLELRFRAFWSVTLDLSSLSLGLFANRSCKRFLRCQRIRSSGQEYKVCADVDGSGGENGCVSLVPVCHIKHPIT